ncbi:unnamed protein product [Rotaria sordida]|uniref:Uncharacterized protein n=1 Tax=Rotaria sordida TaxID=392033 RepID=A0A818VG00_9BILA|nr:unnamed protein product [Rotaria sordida]CAF3705771.1 unnamed protein product [Rotaria sordida]
MGCGCYSHASTEKDILRVAVFGLENSGKTSLVQCLKTSNKISKTFKYISTHGVIAVNVHLNMQTNINLLIFDCGGCKHQRHIWPHLFNNSDLILFTVDSIDLNCLNDAKQALFDLLTDENLINKPLLIVFTKSDKRKNRNINQLEQALDLFMIQDRPIHTVLFSSITLDGFTLISTWFAYFSYCKLHGKEMKLSINRHSSSIKYQLPKSLNLATSSTMSSTKVNLSNNKKSNLSTTKNHNKISISSLSLERKSNKSIKKIIKK